MYNPGDIVKIKDNYKDFYCRHPNKKKNLQAGDSIVIQFIRPRSWMDCDIGYEAWDGKTYWLNSVNIEFIEKGNIEDCLNFLRRTNRRPLNTLNKWFWNLRNKNESKLFHYIPHYIFNHLQLPLIREDIKNVRYADTEELAYKSVCEAWLRMTPSQQIFLNNVTYLEEIYP